MPVLKSQEAGASNCTWGALLPGAPFAQVLKPSPQSEIGGNGEETREGKRSKETVKYIQRWDRGDTSNEKQAGLIVGWLLEETDFA